LSQNASTCKTNRDVNSSPKIIDLLDQSDDDDTPLVHKKRRINKITNSTTNLANSTTVKITIPHSSTANARISSQNDLVDLTDNDILVENPFQYPTHHYDLKDVNIPESKIEDKRKLIDWDRASTTECPICQ